MNKVVNMIKEKCWECDGNYKYKMVDFSVYGVSLGKFKAKVCDKCGDTIFNEDVSDQIDKIAKKKGLWGLESKTKIGKVGNALDIRLSNRISKFCRVKKGTDINVHPESPKRIIVDIA